MIYLNGIVDMAHPGQGIMDIAGAGVQEVVLDLSLCCSPWEVEKTEGLRNIWHEAKLRGRGYSRASHMNRKG